MRDCYLLWTDLNAGFIAEPASFDDQMFDVLCSAARKAMKRETAGWYIAHYERTRAKLHAEAGVPGEAGKDEPNG